MSNFVFIGVFLCLLANIKCDTPANCTFQDVQGMWEFSILIGNSSLSDKISVNDRAVKFRVELLYPDVAVDEFGNKGFWTMVYNQGFEVVIMGRKFFAFSKYVTKDKKVMSYCDRTMTGWSHDLLGRDWATYIGTRVNSKSLPKVSVTSYIPRQQSKHPYKQNEDFINQINSHQSSWKATHYDEYENMTLLDMMRRAGGRVTHRIRPAPADEEVRNLASFLPDEFDWRNVEGINFVSPVRNQASCGSCYAFSSVGMNEARARVITNNTYQPVFSPQDVVECSQYSQGCEGGFPYLIGGKYAEDYGLVEEKCNPYKGTDGKCSTPKSCTRQYSTSYRYIGGYYGGCNEELMKLALYKNGPLSVSFMVYSDFMHYRGGVYQHTGLQDKFNPFELTNHAVLLVGYGIDRATGLHYWTVKNSWGDTWGEKGYFRIRRGVDECAIESIAVESSPVF